MSSQDRIRRIQFLSTALICLAVAFMAYHLWTYLSLIIPLAFTEPGMLQRWFGYPNADIIIPLSTRIVYFLATLIPNLAAIGAVAFGIRLMLHFRNIEFFERETISTIRKVGICLVALAFSAVLATVFINPWVTQHNPAGALPLNFRISTSDLGYLLAGTLLFIIGWVMGEALKIQEENKAFV